MIMTDDFTFVYEKEYWYISVFVNSVHLDVEAKLDELTKLIKDKVKNLTADDLSKISWNEKWVKKVQDMGKNMYIESEWNNFLEGFPYHEENTNLSYNKLGWFEFRVEYYKDDPEKKKEIEPILIQQIPIVISNLFEDFCALKVNDYLNIDTESPIYDFVISAKTHPGQLEWTEEQINNHKRAIGDWSVVYTGSWPDYNEKLYDNRIKNNLSNRTSELHYLRRNSGFIYMHRENFENFFQYMVDFVMIPTARIRAIQFALMSINQSLDILFLRQTKEIYMEMSIIEEKMRNLKQLRGLIQTQMSKVYYELDYNRRQHYTAVLSYLVNIFNLKPNGIIKRITDKFEIIYDSMRHLYQKKQEENQQQTEKSINILNLLFSLGILADFSGLLIGVIEGENLISGTINLISSIVIIGVFLYTVYIKVKITMEEKKEKVSETSDAIIINEDNQIVMVVRKEPPFKGQYALPGGFIEKGETAEQACIREVKEETNLDVEIIRKIGVYDDPDRDPRGNIISHAFLCKSLSSFDEIEGDDDAVYAQAFSVKELEGLDLAFDHEFILKDALKLRNLKKEN
ncbi:MAG: NUDIX domain-containing protein [Candidatus Lokiarchaeota archaeon]|nr:NUDIX domain-containing protein [Candidatus Lokiarchaeota archaeon]